MSTVQTCKEWRVIITCLFGFWFGFHLLDFIWTTVEMCKECRVIITFCFCLFCLFCFFCLFYTRISIALPCLMAYTMANSTMIFHNKFCSFSGLGSTSTSHRACWIASPPWPSTIHWKIGTSLYNYGFLNKKATQFDKIIQFICCSLSKILVKYKMHTAIPYRVSTGPEQGFPFVVNSHREKPVFITRNLCSHCRDPVFITGTSLWELLHREIPVDITGNEFTE